MTTATKARTGTDGAVRRPIRMRAYNPDALQQRGVNRKERIIYGYAVITRGEALGHHTWIDHTFLDQVVTVGNQAPNGIKCRFTHPGLCSDGLGKFLGRARKFRRDGRIVRADLHFAKTSQGPEMESDPATYIMDLAEEDPHAFATSIVFYPDYGAEDRFIGEHEDENGNFKSPDTDNVNDYPHARLARLSASDIVDEPAANPGGFLSDDEQQAATAEAAMEYALGLTAAPPPPGAFGVMDPERVRTFVSGFMARHGLALPAPEHKEPDVMTDDEKVMPAASDEEAVEEEGDGQQAEPEAPEQPVDAPQEPEGAGGPAEPVLSEAEGPEPEPALSEAEGPDADPRAALALMLKAFPNDVRFAIECFQHGRSPVEARAAYADVLAGRLEATAAELKARDVRIDQLVAENAGIRRTLLAGAEPLDHAPEPKQATFMALAEAYQAEHKCSWTEAVKAVQKDHPDLYTKP